MKLRNTITITASLSRKTGNESSFFSGLAGVTGVTGGIVVLSVMQLSMLTRRRYVKCLGGIV